MTEPDDRPAGIGQGAEVNFPTPPTRAAVPHWYPELLDAVADCVRTGRRRAVSAANQELVSTYWAMGTEILARQDFEGWGARVIDRLSVDLREWFPGTSGFSPRNLKYIRAFAAAWPDFAIVQGWLAQLPWYHHVALLDKLDDRAWAVARRLGSTVAHKVNGDDPLARICQCRSDFLPPLATRSWGGANGRSRSPGFRCNIPTLDRHQAV